MEFLSQVHPAELFYYYERFVDDWFFVIAMALFVLEMLRYTLKKQMSKDLIGDSITNYITLVFFIGITFLIGLAYLSVFYYVYDNFRITDIPLTGWTVLGCLVLADLAYYWEHRFLHSNGFAWGTHSVHHSSPHFNISVAYRFGPLDWLFPMLFHLPLALLGFHPLIIFLCEKVVQIYQTLLHTESVGKMPKFIEAVMNTASHHRVHHATNTQYLDKNYAGILIIWDRMFGTFAREEETVRYGVYPRINTNNPIKVFFGGYGRLFSKIWHAPGWKYRLNLLVKPPVWAWKQEQAAKQGKDRCNF